MIGPIFKFLAELVGLGAWWAKRKAAQNDDPKNQHRERIEKIEADVATLGTPAASAPALTLSADADLDELDRLQNENTARDQRRPA